MKGFLCQPVLFSSIDHMTAGKSKFVSPYWICQMAPYLAPKCILNMKNAILILVAATALGLTGCFEKAPASPTGSLLRSHFIGMNQANELTNHLKLSEV